MGRPRRPGRPTPCARWLRSAYSSSCRPSDLRLGPDAGPDQRPRLDVTEGNAPLVPVVADRYLAHVLLVDAVQSQEVAPQYVSLDLVGELRVAKISAQVFGHL